ncbi:EscJ/YscJ/HrcJ family type III secretion inner membrane ring protein [Burkholderia sp. SG-MS1]|uniref:type III secretion system inner membrane ring lipoprotein SctJ n=1 Tax=Paraburkholderia sp. SG-MS1 TaxID=2023741 RepID=UPI001447523F|nr:type III secretion inner membrane ring lipoprotein SctJ [Paraburkholderia sp. SG-MS1]NKJ45233.1 EscJ/YscJ/HrcJ family type III secretion inner membrane ring protein [Paraburkholderia sp. SG-MS1]
MRRVLILLPLIFLVGCKSSLFESLDEDQANQIIAVLSQHGIDGVKERNADRTWSVSVGSGNVVTATEITREYALPHGGHANLGELFSRQGLISNPGEDQVRYVYGLTQELSETLEKIDGVLVARVHIVQPERDPLMRQVTAPSASVMIRYRSDYNVDYMKDKIRGLVAGSVEGLAPDHVYLTLVPVTPVVDAVNARNGGNACAGSSDGNPHRAGTLMLMIMTVMAIALTISAWVWGKGIRSFAPTFYRRRKTRKTAEQTVSKQPEPPAGKDAP